MTKNTKQESKSAAIVEKKATPAKRVRKTDKKVEVASKEVAPKVVELKPAAQVKIDKAKKDKTKKDKVKKEKPKKVKMIRDSFTMPESDYIKLAELKKKCLEAGVHVKKSELLRAGLLSLSALSSQSLINTVNQVEIIKTGRPAKS